MASSFPGGVSDEMSDKTTAKLVGFSITGDGASYNIHGNLESITLTAAQAQRAGERMIALEHRIADLEAQLAEAQRREGLLRGFAFAAQLYISKSVGDPDVYPDTYAAWLDYLAKMQAAIDGGALEGGE